MLKSCLATVVLIACLHSLATTASAQYPGIRSPRSGPTISPYLNLLRGGGIGANYYQRVRPEQEFRTANQTLNQSVDTLRQRIQEQERRGEQVQSGLSQTGHVPRFMNLGGYYPGFGAPAGGSGFGSRIGRR